MRAASLLSQVATFCFHKRLLQCIALFEVLGAGCLILFRYFKNHNAAVQKMYA